MQLLFTATRQKYLRTNLMASFTTDTPITNGDLDNNKMRDIFDPRLFKLIKSIKRYAIYPYNSSVPLTTVSYVFYQTASLAWVIHYYNGITHELEISENQILKIPDLREVGPLFTEAIKSNIGQSVII